MGSILLDVLTKKRTFNTWLGVQCAEAYAANGAYIHFYVDPGGLPRDLDKVCWAKAIETSGFVLAHRDLFEGDLRSGSPLAVLFLLNELGRTIPGVFPSYLGLAQALVEGTYPFDVVFAGDGRYVKDRLAPQSLDGYKAVLVPGPIQPTENQKRVIRDFVKSGGTLICQEPERLDLRDQSEAATSSDIACAAGQFAFGDGIVIRLKGEVTATGTNDVGSRFFRSYDPTLRRQMCQLVERVGVRPVLDGDPDGLVGAFPIVQAERKRVVVHVVNYDVDLDGDAIREKKGLEVVIPRDRLSAPKVRGDLYVAGSPRPTSLEVRVTQSSVRCIIPRVGVSASLVLSE
jgi:hypothetical protein